MFDIGMTELLVIGIVALIVVGPKDLPGMFRTLGRFTGKIKGMAREFQRAMEDAADESGVKDINRDLKGLSNPKKYGLDKLDEASKAFQKWEPGKSPSSRPKSATPRAGSQSATDRANREAAARANDETVPAAQPAPAMKSTGNAAESPLTTESGGEDRE
ncbi:Sec-independent protein translocase protein TatB [Palleronia sp. LCG004]|uniref:Sec-independent protein translocase protein TatB n=1 Tax=Palleronia sp. LCG004 TaxID=3079304 RepID=UPI0029433E11|nr:Sec-independent protein translocase protein TatB [Palleronia sp. LCG004]WOI57332.1 Sec-independent protein translocase protein TatB [Palleronia sp. LCG004]